MPVEKSFAPPQGEPQEEPQVIEVNEAVLIEDDGNDGVIIQFGEETPDIEGVEHHDNLAEYMEESELTTIGLNVIDMYNSDRRSRSKWEKSYKQGLKLLGLDNEDVTEPFAGACNVFHPLLIESVVRFQAHAVMETFPAGGPVKTKIIGKTTAAREKQARRIKEDMNYISTEVMPDYRDEHERMLMNLPLSGSAFKKVWFDQDRGRPVAEFVPADDVVVSYGSVNVMNCQRLTHVMREPENVIRRRIRSGFYRDIGDFSAPTPEYTDIEESEDKVSGETPAIEHDDRNRILEMQVDLDLNPPFASDDSIARPYVVTVMDDGKVLAIRRNWDQIDPLANRLQHFTHYTYLPGLGFYGIGLINLIGNLAQASTSILRQLIDAGTFSNIPAGFKAKGWRAKGMDEPFRPGEWRDVDVPGDKVRDSLLPLPYKEPSVVLLQLLQGVVEEGRKLGSIADLDIKNIGGDTPVGTTLALMERSLKIMSAVQSRLHKAMGAELKLLSSMVRDNMPSEYEYETDEGATRTEDYDGRVDVVPVSDPNASTMAQKVIQHQAAIQGAASAPSIYDMRELHRGQLNALNIPNAEKIIPMDEEMKPKDPVAENMAIMKQEPVKVFEYQDHEAHIVTHMAAMKDPRITELVGQSPNAAAIHGSMTAHITEHVAHGYRKEMEKALGTHLPPLDEALPPDVEASLAPLLAQASGKVLNKGLQEAEDRKNKERQEDPVVQLQMREMALKETKAREDAKIKNRELDLEKQKMDSVELVAGANLGLKAVIEGADIESKEKLAGLRAGVEAVRNAGMEKAMKERDSGKLSGGRDSEKA